MDSVCLVADGWDGTSVEIASTFVRRWRGLRPRADGRSLLLETRSVHTVGMAEPIHVVFLDEALSVLEVRTVVPNRVCIGRGANWVLEMDERREPPTVGTRLRRLAL